jgi:hypothetical protein
MFRSRGLVHFPLILALISIDSMARIKQTVRDKQRQAGKAASKGIASGFIIAARKKQQTQVKSIFISLCLKLRNNCLVTLGGREGSTTLSARHCGSSRNSAFPEVDRASHPQAALPTTCARNSTGHTS